MDKAVQILLGAMILVLLVRACVLAMRAWRDEKEHLRHLRDDRKAKEADFPD
jgi:hypothetical protein